MHATNEFLTHNLTLHPFMWEKVPFDFELIDWSTCFESSAAFTSVLFFFVFEKTFTSYFILLIGMHPTVALLTIIDLPQ